MVAQPRLNLEEPPIEDLIRSGNHREAIALCVEQHGPALGRLCMAMLGSQSEAEEVLQETLVAAFKSMSSFRGDGSARAWLFTIARRQCAKRLAKGARRPGHLAVLPTTDETTPAIEVGKKQRAIAVRSALAGLKPSEREAVVLRYESGLSYREIATACGIEESAARKRVSRALVHLRKLLRPEDVR